MFRWEITRVSRFLTKVSKLWERHADSERNDYTSNADYPADCEIRYTIWGSTMSKKNRQRSWLKATLCAAVMSAGIAGTTGCQISESGQTLPSPYYIRDDVQFFPADSEFKLQREANLLKAFRAEQTLRSP